MSVDKKVKTGTLKLFNGRSHGHKYHNHHVYVAAKSMAEAARLVSKACFDGREDLVSVNEIKVYYGKDSWGIHMDGITPTEPCVYTQDNRVVGSKPFRVI